LRFRYSAAENGRPVKKALVYTVDEHHIDKNAVDPDALRVVERLRANGHETYIVGGAVRDLLVDKRPKDFDIVTDATPTRIKRLFRNSRIIGRRFRLVHVFFGPVIFEVSTFRSLVDGTIGNTFGTIDEDVLRRDFTFNALYYDPFTETVVDYVGGVADIRRKRVEPVIPLKTIFVEDPVRMLRAAKYAAVTGFKIPLLLRWKIKSQASLLEPVSPSRLTEEINKILRSGRAVDIVSKMDSLGLFRCLQPNAAARMADDPSYRRALFSALAEMDAAVRKDGDTPMGNLLAFVLRDFLDRIVDWRSDNVEAYRSALAECRAFVLPMNPPRIELENAVRLCFRERGIAVKKARTFEKGRRTELVPDAVKARLRAEVNPGDEPPSDALKKKRKRRRRRKPGAAAAPQQPES
jgi:poly(A) polymerase